MAEEKFPDEKTLVYYRDNCVFMVGAAMMTNRSCSVFEGSTDVDYYRDLIEVDVKNPKRFCLYAKGKKNVESGIETYRNALKGNPEYDPGKPYAKFSFCLDRDFDVRLKKSLYEDDFVYYQMWRVENGALQGFNDIEGFLMSTPALDYVVKYYGLDSKFVKRCRSAVLKAASCVGVFKIANRMVQGEDEYPVLTNGHKGEIDVNWFCKNKLFKFTPGDIEVDLKNLLSNVAALLRPPYARNERDLRLMQVFDYAKDIIAENSEDGMLLPSYELCRGHDMTELLHGMLLCNTKCTSWPDTVEDLEKVLRTLPPRGNKAREGILTELGKYPIRKDFDPRTYEQFLQGIR